MHINRRASFGAGGVVAICIRVVSLAAMSALVAACQTLAAGQPGMVPPSQGVGMTKVATALSKVQRDEVAAQDLIQVYLEPSALTIEPGTPISAADQAKVRWEIDRQLCFKVSERFEIAARPDVGVARLRTTIMGVEPTSQGGSAIAAAASLILPLPARYRGRSISGGLAAESELFTPDGRRAAAITWARSVQGWSFIEPSVSPVGDALQLADPFAAAVVKALVAKSSVKREVGEPDPCARFGPRRSPGRMVGGALLSLGAGLYAPSVTGAGRAPAGEAVTREP